jgi:quercetin dioxygenase-like cupin family protein
MPSQRGDMAANSVTGERAIVRLGVSDSGGKLLVSDVFVRPGGAVVGEHMHPGIDETFTIMSGTVGFRLNGREAIAVPGQRVHAPRGSLHDYWNAGDDEAHLLIEISPGTRFEEMAVNLFGLAMDGKTNAKGMPSLLQMAALGREFDDVVRFARPPRVFQQLMFALLGPIAKARGYIGNDPKYLNMTPQRVEPIGPWPLVAESGPDAI